MLTLNDTSLETFSFGDKDEDLFYILINLSKNPDGIDLAKLSVADPRRFDAVLNEMGCLLMLSGQEVNELVNRGDADKQNLHKSLFELAKQEGILP
ncbi:MAG: hypothetical protein JJ971_04460 [Balneolaceae bacterium]|nr:hypothetical protein [Balneolaceae bacterium]MBO6545627.1 hypothetical protein [Balneolaceae bacterium]MBO6647023.1 hypothetical protein [Balneolaceae bacterium]